ncbi:MAG: Ca2+-binding RTX toxin-like protein [Planctomycetaceae bacterium]
MRFNNWLSSVQNRIRSARKRAASRQPRRIEFSPGRIEHLEPRTMLTVQVTQIIAGLDNELIITTNAGDDISVRAATSTSTVVEVLENGVPVVGIPAIDPATLTRLTVIGDDGNNVINLSAVTGTFFNPNLEIIVDGDDGDDFITGSLDLASTLNGGDGTDVLFGGTQADLLSGGDGQDLLNGGDGDDTLNGGDGGDIINGQVGDDIVNGGSSGDTINGGSGADTLNGQSGNDDILGDTDDDVIDGGSGSDTLDGGLGNDSLSGGTEGDSLLGDLGADTLNGDGGNDSLFGGDDDDLIFGGTDDDSLNGENGNDIVNGNSGNDTAFGSSGDDTILGGSGNDLLYGDGDETQLTPAGNDRIVGHIGDDTIFAGIGSDTVDGGAGDDSIVGGFFDPPLVSIDSIVLGAEGDSGTTTVTFTISLSRPAVGTEQVTYATMDGSATAGMDYTADSDTLTFPVGSSTLSVTIDVIGDGVIEGDEFFFVTISNPVNADLGVFQGSALITDDDPLRLFAVFDTASEIVEIDPTTGARLNSFPTPVPTTFGPDGIAYDGNTVFFLAGNSTIFELDPDTGAIRDQDTFTPAGNFDAIATLGGVVYLQDFVNNDIVLFDTVTDTVTGTLDIDGVNPGFGIVGGLGAVSGGGGPDRLVASDFSTRQIHEIDPATGLITNSFTATTPGAPLYFGAAGIDGELYLGSNSTGDVDVFSRAGVLLRTFNVGTGITALGGDGIVANTSPPLPPPPPPANINAVDDTLRGGTGNDTIIGSRGNDLIDGQDGNDSLEGGGGDDTLVSGAGDDTLSGGSGQDTISGGEGNNTVTGGSGGDVLIIEPFANGGNTALDTGGADSVEIRGTAGSDTFAISQAGGLLRVTTATASITVSSSVHTVRIVGMDGDDTVTMSSINDTRPLALIVDLGDGADTFDGQSSLSNRLPIQVLGEGGDDTITGTLNGDILDGGDGNDVISGDRGEDSIRGGAGNDTLSGDRDDDQLLGGNGADSLFGGTGDDLLQGGNDDDRLNGNSGHDTLEGELGNDTLLAGSGNDLARGGSGSDSIKGQSGHDTLFGGGGGDTIRGEAGNDVINGGDGDDSIRGGTGSDLITGGEGSDAINGEAGNDTLLGDDGDDSMIGGSGADIVLGGDGDDRVSGSGSNADTVAGNEGDDLLLGNQASEIDETFTVADEILDMLIDTQV